MNDETTLDEVERISLLLLLPTFRATAITAYWKTVGRYKTPRRSPTFMGSRPSVSQVAGGLRGEREPELNKNGSSIS